MRKTLFRSKSVTTKVTDTEYAELEQLATAKNMNLSEWVRSELLRPPSSPSTEVLLPEILALRSIIVNTLYSMARGKTVTAEAMQALIDQADRDRLQLAHERLTNQPKMMTSERPIKALEGNSRG
jgi:hypothetical protein